MKEHAVRVPVQTGSQMYALPVHYFFNKKEARTYFKNLMKYCGNGQPH
jgi:hypothetical protein